MANNIQQEKILHAPTNQNIAVSAGAGTGKSTTLRNKVIDLISRRVFKPSEFLIVTFTNEAANSLRNKIKSEVRKNKDLSDLVTEVDSMHIDTIDAFRLFIVKKYSKYLNISGDIGIIDDQILEIEQNKIVDELFYKLCESKNELLKEFTNSYIVKSFDDIKKHILKLSNYIDPKLDYEQNLNYFLNKYNAKQLKTFVEDYLVKTVGKKIKNIIEQIQYLLDEASNYGDENPIKFIDVINNKLDGFTDFDSFKGINNGIKHFKNDSDRINKDKRVPTELYDEIKKLVDQLKKIKIYDLNNFEEEIEINKHFFPLFFDIAFEASKKIHQFMKDKGKYRFQDIASMALSILDFEQPLNEIKTSFKMIMIDEYQDDSDIDDAFFTKISNNNLLLVGDVKQSIYGFKGANPEKFNEKYIEYSKLSDEPYTMNINYRSRKEILDGVNRIFEKFMDEKHGGVNYLDNHDLRYDKNDRYDIKDISNKKDIGLHYFRILSKDEALEKINSICEEQFNEYDIKNNEYYISCALNIIDRISNHAKVSKVIGYDENNKEIYGLVDATFSDFGILARNNVANESCRRIFNALGIPINIVADEIINEDILTKTLMSFIKIIDIFLQNEGFDQKNNDEIIYIYEKEEELKLCLTSILRSFVMNYNDQQIFDLLGSNKYENNKLIINYSYKKSDVYNNLLNFAFDHKSSSIYQIMLDLVNQFHFVEKLSNIGNAISYLQKLNAILDNVKSMDSIGYQLSDLSYYFENLNRLNLKFSIRLGSDSNNAVTIETFHKSKGLEFPIVYVDCTRAINCANSNIFGDKVAYYFNEKHGLFLPNRLIKTGVKCTPIREAENELVKINNISEETRLFYVALTRAKECAVMVYPNEEQILDIDDKDDVSNYYDIVKYSKHNVDIDEYGFTDHLLKKQIQEFIPSKVIYKPNQLNYDLRSLSKRPSIELDSEASDYLLNKGIRYHSYMQYVDLITKDTSFINNKKERQDIDKVLSNDIFKDLNNVSIYKEYKYYDEDNDVCGVIDLLLIYEDHALIVDYKLKNADEIKYKKQLDSYIDFVRKTFNIETQAILLPLLG